MQEPNGYSDISYYSNCLGENNIGTKGRKDGARIIFLPIITIYICPLSGVYKLETLSDVL
jgi:hypothetical protein